MNKLTKIKLEGINTKQLTYILNKTKKDTYNKMLEVNFSYTGDYGVTVRQELLENNITWTEISGTKCRVVICYDSTTFTVVRRPKNAKVETTVIAHNINGKELI